MNDRNAARTEMEVEDEIDVIARPGLEAVQERTREVAVGGDVIDLERERARRLES